jgi:hypothetical protein
MRANGFSINTCDNCGEEDAIVRHVDDKHFTATICTMCKPIRSKVTADRLATFFGAKVQHSSALGGFYLKRH